MSRVRLSFLVFLFSFSLSPAQWTSLGNLDSSRVGGNALLVFLKGSVLTICSLPPGQIAPLRPPGLQGGGGEPFSFFLKRLFSPLSSPPPPSETGVSRARS